MNPQRESSGSQFYIVWGKVYKPQELKQLEKQMAMQQEQQVFNRLVAEHRTEVMNLRKNRDQAGLLELQNQLVAETKATCAEMGKPSFTEEQTKAYTTVGGTPFLDGQYTVFGEVVEGLDVVDKIQQVETHTGDRPSVDVSMTMEVIEDKKPACTASHPLSCQSRTAVARASCAAEREVAVCSSPFCYTAGEKTQCAACADGACCKCQRSAVHKQLHRAAFFVSHWSALRGGLFRTPSDTASQLLE